MRLRLSIRSDIDRVITMKKFIVLCIILLLSLHCKEDASRKIIIFHAGSLAVPMKHLKTAYEKKNSDIAVLLESSGSREAARKVRDLHRDCDIVASADSTVIYNLLIPEHADFCIDFATNEMAIMYHKKSRYADRINKDNWYRILLRDDVSYGHSDPDKDPCGYRSQLVWKLAEKYYRERDLYKRLRAGCPPRNIRPKEVDLIALLEAGVLDYAFIYRSVAIQHRMPFLELPEEINLGSYRFNSFYKQVRHPVTGKKPGEVIYHEGKAIVYGLTMVKNPQNLPDAIGFLEFMLGTEGRAIIDRDGQKPVNPPVSRERERVPERLKKLVRGM